MRVLILGDIYGTAGRALVKATLPTLKLRLEPDWVIANGENATGGAGLSAKHRDDMFKAGVDLLTSGNHIFARSDWTQVLTGSERVLRPHNLGGDEAPGKGWGLLQADGKPSLGVINLAGRVFMEQGDCPFRWAERLIERFPAKTPIVVDFHAEATSEKIALAQFLDGRVSAVLGTHTHVATADERILPKGTAAQTDLGMTGPRHGIIGVTAETVLQRFVQGYSDRFTCAEGEAEMTGALIEIASDGRATAITRIREGVSL